MMSRCRCASGSSAHGVSDNAAGYSLLGLASPDLEQPRVILQDHPSVGYDSGNATRYGINWKLQRPSAPDQRPRALESIGSKQRIANCTLDDLLLDFI
jgi:hypothetical protein